MLRSLLACPSKLWSGVTFHFSTPHAGISRSIWSTSSLEEASRMKTQARSATGCPPARIFLSASSFKSASKVGRIPFSKTSRVSSGEANPGPSDPTTNISSSHSTKKPPAPPRPFQGNRLQASAASPIQHTLLLAIALQSRTVACGSASAHPCDHFDELFHRLLPGHSAHRLRVRAKAERHAELLRRRGALVAKQTTASVAIATWVGRHRSGESDPPLRSILCNC
jgi:hypothetical protein